MRKLFFCVDGHTGGNPVRMVVGGAPFLNGCNMSERRQDFVSRYDWIRKGLMLEPRGHDIMSGGFVLPPINPDNDGALLFMEVSGTLPMCGHGSVGMITFAIEHGVILPRKEGTLRLEVPAGILDVEYTRMGDKVTSVSFASVPSFLYATDVNIVEPELGVFQVDIAYGGNFYAIIEPQDGYGGVGAFGLRKIVSASPRIRKLIEEKVFPVHPLDASINGVTHILWSDTLDENGRGSSGAVFCGQSMIDHGPCGTGTAARLAQLHAKGRLPEGEDFEQRSHVGTRFTGTILNRTKVGDYDAITPVLKGSAHVTGYNQIWIDTEEPFPEGLQVVV